MKYKRKLTINAFKIRVYFCIITGETCNMDCRLCRDVKERIKELKNNE